MLWNSWLKELVLCLWFGHGQVCTILYSNMEIHQLNYYMWIPKHSQWVSIPFDHLVLVCSLHLLVQNKAGTAVGKKKTKTKHAWPERNLWATARACRWSRGSHQWGRPSHTPWSSWQGRKTIPLRHEKLGSTESGLVFSLTLRGADSCLAGTSGYISDLPTPAYQALLIPLLLLVKGQGQVQTQVCHLHHFTDSFFLSVKWV